MPQRLSRKIGAQEEPEEFYNSIIREFFTQEQETVFYPNSKSTPNRLKSVITENIATHLLKTNHNFKCEEIYNNIKKGSYVYITIVKGCANLKIIRSEAPTTDPDEIRYPHHKEMFGMPMEAHKQTYKLLHSKTRYLRIIPMDAVNHIVIRYEIKQNLILSQLSPRHSVEIDYEEEFENGLTYNHKRDTESLEEYRFVAVQQAYSFNNKLIPIAIGIMPMSQIWETSTKITPRVRIKQFIPHINGIKAIDLLNQADIDEIITPYRNMLYDKVLVTPDPEIIIKLLKIPFGWLRGIYNLTQNPIINYKSTSTLDKYNELTKKVYPHKPIFNIKRETEVVKDIFNFVKSNTEKQKVNEIWAIKTFLKK